MALSNTQRVLAAFAAAATIWFSASAIAAARPAASGSAPHASAADEAFLVDHARSSRCAASTARARAGRLRVRSRNAHAAQTQQVAIPVVDARAVARNGAAVAREFDHWLDGVEASGDVAGLATAIVQDQRVLLERGIGFANEATREPVAGDTVFRLASLSKAFATALTGLLVEDGLLTWDTKIAHLLPTFTLNDVADGERVTVRDILSHRVGLPHNTYDRLLEQDEPYELLVDRLKEVPLTCRVGECYAYQNIAFSLIGDVTYAATGDFYYHQVEKRLFHPLGMTTATYGRDALEGSKSWARPHRRVGGTWTPFVPNETYYRVAPAAGVNASIRDMEQWLIAQMGGRPRVLSPALLAALHTPLVETERETRSTPWRRGRVNDAQYALGWRIYDYAGTTLVFHAGAVQGYRAMIAFLPRYRFGVVMLWNCESAAPSGLLPMLLDRYLGLPEVNWAGLESHDTDALRGDAD